MGTGQRYGAPAAKRGMDERRLGGLAPGNCLLTASEQYDVVSHRRRFLPSPWPLFGAAFCLWALSGVPQRVSQVSMGTMVCFLANASINPQTGSGNRALVSGRLGGRLTVTLKP